MTEQYQQRLVAARLRAARERAGITQQEMARVLKCAQSSVARWESDREIGLPELYAWARAAETTVAAILGLAESESPESAVHRAILATDVQTRHEFAVLLRAFADSLEANNRPRIANHA